MRASKLAGRSKLAQQQAPKNQLSSCYTCDDGGHHGSKKDKELIEEEEPGIVVDDRRIVANAPVEQAHQNADDNVPGKPQQSKQLHTKLHIRKEW